MNTLTLLKNNFLRIKNYKPVLIIAVIVVPIFIAIAVLFTARINAKASLAVVSQKPLNLPSNSKVQIEILKTKPADSTLLDGKYAAIITQKPDGTYLIDTIKSKVDKEKINSYLKTGRLPNSNERGAGTNILGFILIIIMSQAVALMLLFPEDRFHKTFRRILTAPASEAQYLAAQGIFTFVCLYIPTFLAVAITKVCFGVSVGFSLPMLALLIAILSAFSTAFALLISSVMGSNASVAATCISIITCVLAGCFFSFTGSNRVFDAICGVIPQKAYMTMIQGIEGGKSLFLYKGQLLYLLIWIVGLWLSGSIITSRKVKKGVF